MSSAAIAGRSASSALDTLPRLLQQLDCSRGDTRAVRGIGALDERQREVLDLIRARRFEASLVRLPRDSRDAQHQQHEDRRSRRDRKRVPPQEFPAR